MKNDVVVIGGGMTGLATGALLAKQGKRVAVLEKGNKPGGRAYTYEEKGFTLNYGPHAVYRPHSGVLAELMARLGREVPPTGYPDALRSYWSDGDRFASMGAKPHQVLTTKLFTIGERVHVVQFMMKIRSAKPEDLPEEMTWGEWVRSVTRDPAIIRFARAFGVVNTYTRLSEQLSARFLLAHLKRNLFAKDYVGYMHGGWRRMYDAFIAELEANGGSLATGARIQRIEVEDGRVVAIATDAARYTAEAFVCTVPPQDAASMAVPGTSLEREMARHAGVEDVRALCMDLGFATKVRTDIGFVFDIERDLYFSMHSDTAPDLAPAGGQLLHAMAYLSGEEAASDELLQRRKDELTEGLDRFFPGWRDALAVERTLPNVRVATLRQTPELRARRQPLRSAAASNLYFAGDARDIEGNLTEICLRSAMQVADAIAASAARVTREPVASAVPARVTA